jgi:acetyl esterase/lipase
MSDERRAGDIARRVVLYSLDGADAATVRRDVEYATTDAGPLTMDVYRPPGSSEDERLPCVVIVAGYPDAGFERFVGCKFKDMGSSVSWCRLLAASGLVAIAYANREPVADLHALLDYIRQSSAALGVDASRIGVWASSGNVPLALSLLMEGHEYLRCAALCYGLTLDLDGDTSVADAAGTFGFVNPTGGKSVEDLPAHVPLLLARAGRDEFPRLNEAMDRFVAAALACNLPITLVNHPTAPHAFDLVDDGDETRRVVRQVLAFLRSRLR